MTMNLKNSIWVLLAVMLLFPLSAEAADTENCLMCHKYAGLGRYEKGDGFSAKKRIFYVNAELFKASYHGKLRCRSCHEGVDEIPHKNVTKIDCATDCHLNDPSTGKSFSHKKIVNDLNESAHGAKGSRGKDKDDLPTCKYCHSNKPYQTSLEKNSYLKVCLECHQSEAWVNRFYKHMIYRVSKRRPSKDIINLCSSCHADTEKMGRHDLDIIVGFKDTFHAKAINYGNETVANCLNCHAPYELGFSPHRIFSRRDDQSPVSPKHKIKTCRLSDCHPGAQEKFAAGGKVHPSGAKGILARSSSNTSLTSTSEDALFQAKVVWMINLFYKILIAAVVGGFVIHRVLDLFAMRRELKRGGH